MRERLYLGALLVMGLPAVALGQSVRASWEAVTEDINGEPENLFGYHIYYGTVSGGPYPQGFSTGNVLETRIDNLQNGQRYYFVVTAIDVAGNESAYSNEAVYDVPLEDCNNLLDDDHDGLVDCQDVECPNNPEVCDGFDNDCDSVTDNHLEAPACPLQDGVCAGSVQPCGGAAGYLPCNAAAYGPNYQQTESRCDGLDNDCDGRTDEDLEGPLCPLQLGVCAGARRPCTGSGGFGNCDGSVYGPDYQAEENACDDLDNDCDGEKDENCSCTPGETSSCSTNVGECTVGIQECGQNGVWGSCSGVLPAPEVCDGLDNNCDGGTDEGLVGQPCPLQRGVCAGSRQLCGGTAGWLACNGDAYGAEYEDVETRCDGLDNDCDGQADEDDVCLVPDGGQDGDGDAGGDAGADAGPDAGVDDGADANETDAELKVIGSCSCSSSRGLPALSLFLFAWACLIRRRR